MMKTCNSLAYSSDVLSCYVFCEQTLVAETCANLLRFTLSVAGLTSTRPDEGGITRSDSYHPERLPYALVARLEGLAQHAPIALQSLYLDAYSGTDGLHSALSGVGSSTYGVFDGLDYQNLYVPTSPPRKSPHKAHSVGDGDTNHTSGLIVLKETEDDEF